MGRAETVERPDPFYLDYQAHGGQLSPEKLKLVRRLAQKDLPRREIMGGNGKTPACIKHICQRAERKGISLSPEQKWVAAILSWNLVDSPVLIQGDEAVFREFLLTTGGWEQLVTDQVRLENDLAGQAEVKGSGVVTLRKLEEAITRVIEGSPGEPLREEAQPVDQPSLVEGWLEKWKEIGQRFLSGELSFDVVYSTTVDDQLDRGLLLARGLQEMFSGLLVARLGFQERFFGEPGKQAKRYYLVRPFCLKGESPEEANKKLAERILTGSGDSELEDFGSRVAECLEEGALCCQGAFRKIAQFAEELVIDLSPPQDRLVLIERSWSAVKTGEEGSVREQILAEVPRGRDSLKLVLIKDEEGRCYVPQIWFRDDSKDRRALWREPRH